MKKLLLLLLCLSSFAFTNTSGATPRSAEFEGLTLHTGDVIFQQISGELGRLVQGVTRSDLDHCGIVVVNEDGTIDVIEAITQVQRTPLEDWIARGQNRHILVLRPTDELSHQVTKVVSSAEAFLGKPYDMKFRMDDESIYCSELVWKAYFNGTGVKLHEPETLAEHRYMPYLPQILWITEGESPFDRPLITPAGLTASPHLSEIVNDFKGAKAKRNW